MRAAKFIRLYVERARALMRPVMGLNSCIAACRVTVECLKLQGIEARVHSAKFVVEIPSMKTAYAVGLDRAEYPGNTWTPGPWEFGWCGHLLVEAPGCLIDPAFDQAMFALNLPVEMGMFAMPLQEILSPRERIVCKAILDKPLLELKIQYALTEDNSYLNTPAWNDEVLSDYARFIVNRLRA